MDFLNLFASPITEIFKCLIPLLKRQIDYFVHCERKLEQLRKKVEDLENTRDDVQRRVDIAKRDIQSIRGVVEAWLERVRKETTPHLEDTIVGLVMNDDEAERMINQQFCRGWCSCRSGTRYDLGRKAEKKMVIIDQLLNEGRSFNDVSDPFLPGTEVLLPTNQDFEVFASRESIKNEVKAALKDEGIYLIGVYGMGGVGKTTLMTQVAKQVKEENIFDEVAMTTISHNIDLKKMQNEIAEMLGLTQLKGMDNISARAALLSKRLKQTKRILVILDDLWSTNLNLSDVGIPYGENYHKGCKVVITTRSLDVCNSMRSQKYINVAVLSKEESWHLFKKNVGDEADSPVLQSVAKEIAKECGGLPVALVTLGRALRNKDKIVWDDAAIQLKKSNFPCIDEGMNSIVFASIKLSYDYLRYEMIKKCFLFCCLFPEDHKIQMYELMAYAIGDDGILEDSETLTRASSRLHAILDKILASSLLLGKKTQSGTYVVWMHDIIRDVAILIASQEGNGFFVKAGAGLSDWPKRIRLLSSSSTNGECLRHLSLMENGISVLPEEPELPDLLSLSLNGNRSLRKIPDSFFRRMASLATLDLTSTGISSLPSSLSFLVNLRTLYLDYCELNQSTDISLIGKLKNLAILSLKGSKLQRLPEEIRGLTNLKVLNLSRSSHLNIIPPNVISRLSRLEYLNMEYCSNVRWDFDESENGSNVSLAEVASLPCLTYLVLTISRKQINTEDPAHEYVVRFEKDFCYGLDAPTDKQWVNDCWLDLVPHPVCHSIKGLMQRVRKLILCRFIGLNSMGQLVGAGFNILSDLVIRECHDMEYLMNMENEEIPRSALVALKELTISSMNKLKYIFYGPIPIGFLDNLAVLNVHVCEEMVCCFGPNLVKRVPNLEELEVVDCGMLKDVFHLETGSTSLFINEKEINVAAIFSKLRSIVLCNLPVLETIWKGEISFRFLENLKRIEVENCDKLRSLFSPSMARNLKQLEKLEVSFCKSMVKLISSDHYQMSVDADHQDQLQLMIFFPNLKHLKIRGCNSLEQLWDGKNSLTTVLDCPLEYLKVVRCENLKTRILLTHRCTLQLKEIVGDSMEWFHGLEWEDASDKLLMQPLFKVCSSPPL
ncbi:Disease resistance protein [Macleaya cordata]|uniref:Disease resistance protein n=1 Tax=Macleaya cordata TaxID=56857 RepID=A0A200QUI0_MACCD|nr:Disease resistance protein [Macleaya cordata]